MQDAIDPNTPANEPQTLLGQPAGTPDDGVSDTGLSREDLSIGLIAVGSVMMLVVIGRLLSRRRPVNRPDDQASRPSRQTGQPAFTSTASHDRLERMMTDAEELTRRLAAVLDNKAAKIEVLIEQADDRLRALEEAHAQPAPIAPVPSPSPAPPNEPPAPLSIDPLHRKVYDLADQGLTPVDIARQIDKPTGQIELILALRRA